MLTWSIVGVQNQLGCHGLFGGKSYVHPAVAQPKVTLASVVALTRSDPEEDSLSLYGSIIALPQLPSAPSVNGKPSSPHGYPQHSPPKSLTPRTKNFPFGAMTLSTSFGQKVFLASHSIMAYTRTVQSSPFESSL